MSIGFRVGLQILSCVRIAPSRSARPERVSSTTFKHKGNMTYDLVVLVVIK